MNDEKENAVLSISDEEDEEIDLDELEARLESKLGDELSGLEFLEKERAKIGDPDSLGQVIQNVVWDQFINQLACTAGEDFIKENRDLTLDLRNEAHIQTTDAFAEGKIATHNTHVDYQQRYDDWRPNFVKDENGNIVTHTTRTGKEEPTLAKGARAPFDESRPSGSVEKHTDMDHTIPAAEIIRDPAANAHMTKDEQIAFANSDANLNEMDSSLNRSKGDKSMSDWLDSPNANGQKPDEIFDISDEQKKQLREKDAEARTEYDKQVKDAEQRSTDLGKKSQREEAFRLGGKALRAALMQLLAELVKEIIAKLVKWFKSTKKALRTLTDSIKEAITSFIGKLKTHLLNTADTVITTIATAILGPVVNTIKKAVTLIKQGWKSLKDAIAYIKNPKNKGKPIGILMLEVGKIIIAGMTAAGAIVLGEVIEKGLLNIPIFRLGIPLIGSLASIIGIFLGAVVAGIIGAIAINQIDKILAKKQRNEMTSAIIDKGNEVLQTQSVMKAVKQAKVEETKKRVADSIIRRHEEVSFIINNTLQEIHSNNNTNDTPVVNDETFLKIESTHQECDELLDDISNMLNKMN